MKKLLYLFLIFLIIISGNSMAYGDQPPSMQMSSQTQSTVTYTVSDPDGIRKMQFFYGGVERNAVVPPMDFPCIGQTQVTVPKVVAGARLSTINLIDCNNDSPNNAAMYVFRTSGIPGDGEFVVGLAITTEVRAPPPYFPWELWWIIPILIAIMFFLLWWRAIGPFRR